MRTHAHAHIRKRTHPHAYAHALPAQVAAALLAARAEGRPSPLQTVLPIEANGVAMLAWQQAVQARAASKVQGYHRELWLLAQKMGLPVSCAGHCNGARCPIVGHRRAYQGNAHKDRGPPLLRRPVLLPYGPSLARALRLLALEAGPPVGERTGGWHLGGLGWARVMHVHPPRRPSSMANADAGVQHLRTTF